MISLVEIRPLGSLHAYVKYYYNSCDFSPSLPAFLHLLFAHLCAKARDNFTQNDSKDSLAQESALSASLFLYCDVFRVTLLQPPTPVGNPNAICDDKFICHLKYHLHFRFHILPPCTPSYSSGFAPSWPVMSTPVPVCSGQVTYASRKSLHLLLYCYVSK